MILAFFALMQAIAVCGVAFYYCPAIFKENAAEFEMSLATSVVFVIVTFFVMQVLESYMGKVKVEK